MAYNKKPELQGKRKQVNALCKLYGVSATVSGANTSSVTVTLRKGKIDFLANHVETVRLYERVKQNQIIDNAEFYAKRGYIKCNPYYLDRQFSGGALEFLDQLLVILKTWYIHICIGTHAKPYLLVTKS